MFAWSVSATPRIRLNSCSGEVAPGGRGQRDRPRVPCPGVSILVLVKLTLGASARSPAARTPRRSLNSCSGEVAPGVREADHHRADPVVSILILVKLPLGARRQQAPRSPDRQ